MINWEEARRQGLRPTDLLDEFAVGVPPVPVEDIAREMGVLPVPFESPPDGFEILVTSQPAYEGARHRKVYVLLDPDLSERRRRYLVAQALGHLVRGPMKGGRESTATRTSGEERKAVTFAKHLLLPAWMMHFYIEEGIPVEEVARRFRVPLSVTRDRLRELE